MKKLFLPQRQRDKMMKKPLSSAKTKEVSVVGTTGFEPAAYYSRSNRATKLRQVPIGKMPY